MKKIYSWFLTSKFSVTWVFEYLDTLFSSIFTLSLVGYGTMVQKTNDAKETAIIPDTRDHASLTRRKFMATYVKIPFCAYNPELIILKFPCGISSAVIYK